MSNTNFNIPKIKSSENIFTLKVKTESNGLGALKTLIVILLIALQVAVLVLSYVFLISFFTWYLTFSIILSIIACIHVLSSDYNGQAKATWILFLLISLGFGYIFYLFSDKRVFFGRQSKKYAKILKKNAELQSQTKLPDSVSNEMKSNSKYLQTAGGFKAHTNSKTTYYSSGTKYFDEVIEELKKAKKFIFIEYFIVSNGVVLNKIIKILKEKVQEGVEVRIIYDDMGSHGTFSRKKKKEIKKAGIKLQPFNRLVPVFNIALNLRNHRKIVVVDGKVSFTGGTNLADEYTNEKRMHGYWKDEGIKIEGPATDNFTIAYLNEWEFLTGETIDYKSYIGKTKGTQTNEVVVPFVSGPNYPYSIPQNIYLNLFSSAKEKLYIMTPYFIPDETITNVLIAKACSGVDVRIILPEIADKKFVYIVSRNNAEKLIAHGVKIYTMDSSFVHSKVILTEHSAIVGSINIDLRSFNQQFESAVLLDGAETLNEINNDFSFTLNHSTEITNKNKKRNSLIFRILAGLFNLISPFM